MAQSLAQVYVHVVFSTKDRIACLTPDLRARLFPYMARVAERIECPAVAIGGWNDHIHVLSSLSRILAIASLVEELKVPTSKWLKEQGAALSKFSWQAGYGAFSIGASQIARVCAYVHNQEEHHRTLTFQDEFRELLRRYKIAFDERHVWN